MSHGPHPAAVAMTTDEARAGRSDLDWAVIADPAGALETSLRLLELPEHERSPALGEIFERSFAAWSRGDWELNTLFLDSDDTVFRLADRRETFPGAREEYLGVEGYLEAQHLLRSGFGEVRVSLREILKADAEQVVASQRFTGHGELSGAPFDRESLGLYRFRDGLVIEFVHWWDAARGRRALGLESK